MADASAEVVVEMGGEQLLSGQLWAHRRRGTESATSATPGYLADKFTYGLDPGLPLLEGPQQTPVGRAMFGAFLRQRARPMGPPAHRSR